MENLFRVAVLDDDKIYLNLIKKKIEKMGVSSKIDLRTYSSGKEFLADSFKPNVLILDYYLNGEKYQNGAEVLKKVRKSMKKTMVYMISGQKDENIVLDLLKGGAMDFIEKDGSLLSNLVDHIKTEYQIFRADLKKLRALEVRKKIAYGVAIFGVVPFVLNAINPVLAPVYVALSLTTFMAYAVKMHVSE